jgi:hypothetical protein
MRRIFTHYYVHNRRHHDLSDRIHLRDVKYETHYLSINIFFSSYSSLRLRHDKYEKFIFLHPKKKSLLINSTYVWQGATSIMFHNSTV